MRVEIIRDYKKEDQIVDCNVIRVKSGDDWYEISTREDGINIFTTHQVIVKPNSTNSISINVQQHRFIPDAKSR